VIKLPFAPCAPGAAPASARTPATPAALLCASAPLRVLAVDDHPLNRRILADQLTTLGYTPIEAADADAALAAIEAGVDLVLTDCNMPGTSGSELTRKIRAAEARGARPRLPVLGYTANALPHARIACLGAGMDDVLIKPLDLEQVGAALARWFPDRVAPRAASLLIAPSPVDACMPAEPHAPARPASPVPAGLGESLRDDLTALKRALDIQAWDTAADYAHRIQGVIGCTVRDEAIDQVCVVLEMLARRGAPDAAITLAAQYARLATLLQRYTAAV
jgi:two-component system sensor histidine kinase EvgS